MVKPENDGSNDTNETDNNITRVICIESNTYEIFMIVNILTLNFIVQTTNENITAVVTSQPSCLTSQLR